MKKIYDKLISELIIECGLSLEEANKFLKKYSDEDEIKKYAEKFLKESKNDKTSNVIKNEAEKLNDEPILVFEEEVDKELLQQLITPQFREKIIKGAIYLVVASSIVGTMSILSSSELQYLISKVSSSIFSQTFGHNITLELEEFENKQVSDDGLSKSKQL